MLKIGRYISGNSRIHKMSPVSKIMCTILFIVASFMTNSIRLQALLILLLLLVIFNTKIPFRYYFKSVIKLRWLLGLIAIVCLLLSVPGEIVAVIILRICFIVIYASILTFTTPLNEIAYGLETTMWPLRLIMFPVKKFALNLTLALRFIPAMSDERDRVLKSQASRGLYSNNKLSNLKSIFSLTLRQADNLAVAMVVRLYGINKRRIIFRQNPWGFYDSCLVLFHMVILLGVIFEGAVV